MFDDSQVEEYINNFNSEIKEKLVSLRNLIYSIEPKSVESFNYGMPAYKFNKKPLIYFAAYTNHIGLYATPTTHSKFEKKLSKYKQGKGSVQIPNSNKLPLKLIDEMIRFKIDEILKK